MNQMHRRWFLGLVVVMLVGLFFSMKASAIITAIIVDNYDPKLNGVQGAIIKIEGNKLTLKLTETGKLIILKVRESRDDKHGLRNFRVGDKVKIQDGKLIEVIRPMYQPAPGAGAITITKPTK
jgi:RNase P/RNase MRP subunit p29